MSNVLSENDIDTVRRMGWQPFTVSLMTLTVEHRCAAAVQRLQETIEAAAAKALEQIHRDFTRSRVSLGLKRLVESSKPYRMPPSFRCPDCDGRVLVEINEWSIADRVPTTGGYTVMCEDDTNAMLDAWARDEDYRNRCGYYSSDMLSLHSRVGRWLVRNVEVA